MRINKIITAALLSGASALMIASSMLGGSFGLEGRKYKAYYDVAGVLTVCDGHTGGDIVIDKIYTDDECDSLLERDLAYVKYRIDPLIKVEIQESTRAALYSFTYNVGVSAFARSTLLKKLNANDVVGACDQLKRWVFAGGKPWKGLKNRREIENRVCQYDL